MAVIGTELQERRLDEMGKIAQSVISEIDIPTYKGIFRYAIKNSLADHAVLAWEDMADADQERKRLFFESVLKYASVRLVKLGLTAKQVSTVTNSVKDAILHDLAKK